jgi:uncharacterized protein
LSLGVDEANAEGRAEAQARTDRPAPLRRCIVTGAVGPRAELLRLVVGPEGEIVPDVAGRLPGRGLWLTPRRDIVELARAKRLFGRAARRNVTVADDLADRIEALLASRCLELIGLARRGGQAVAGFDKVRTWLQRGAVGTLIEASDGAADGRRKLVGHGHGLPVVSVLDQVELGMAFGREAVVHAALAPGRLAERFCADSGRLAAMRGGGNGPDGDGKQGL